MDQQKISGITEKTSLNNLDSTNKIDEFINLPKSRCSIIKALYFSSGIIFINLLVSQLRDAIIFAFTRTQELAVIEALTTLGIIIDIVLVAIPWSLTQAYSVDAGRYFSEKKLVKLSKLTNQLYFILLVFSLIICLFLAFIFEPIFSNIMGNEASNNLSTMMRWICIGVPFAYLQIGNFRLFNAINSIIIPAIACLIGLLIEIGFCFLFIYYLEMINFGAVMAINLNYIITFLLQIGYTYLFTPYSELIVSPFIGIFEDFWKNMKKIFFHGFSIFLSILSFEILPFFALIVGDKDFSIVNVLTIILLIFLMFSESFAAGSNIYINYAITQRNYSYIMRLFNYTIFVLSVAVVIIAILLGVFYFQIISYFTNITNLSDIASSLQGWFIVSFIFLSYHAVIAEFITSIGGEGYALATLLIGRVGITIILIIVLMLNYSFKVDAIFLGFVVGQLFTMVGNFYFIYYMFKNKGEELAKAIDNIMTDKEISQIKIN